VVSEAEIVLNTLSEVEGLDDVQQIVDRVCRCVVEISPYRTALLSIYQGTDVYVGLEGGDEELRRRFLESSRNATEEGRAKRRSSMWREYGIAGTNIVWIPEGSELYFGPAYESSEDVFGSEWRPDDRLMVFVRDADGEVQGVLSLDRPADGARPDPHDLGVLESVDRLMTLMGTVIRNKYLAGKLRESEARYGAVVEQGHDGILILRDEVVTFANRRMGELAGVEPSALMGRPLSAIVASALDTALPGESTATLASGVEVALRHSEIRCEGVAATLVAVADISERQRMLNQLMRAQRLESIGTLVSGIAHDFNNLLSGIVGYASLLKTHIGPEGTAGRYVDAIVRATARASDVTRQLLGMVRDEEVRVAPFRVEFTLGELERFLSETLDPSIRVELNCDEGLPRVLGDETQIHQVLLNVCLNARDALPGGGLLRLEAHRAPDHAVRLLVSDSGSGMDSATLSKVFDPFFTTKEAGSGSGLGLFMAYRIVERHGGTMDIVSTPGRGTTVEVVLRGREAGADEGDRSADETGGRYGDGTVLLVDDEELMLEVCGEMLQRLGYDVVAAPDGVEAIEAVREREGRFACVIMDVAMPNMGGWEASRRIRELYPALPVFISSGHDVGAEMGQTHGVEIAGSLKKPYGLDELSEILEQAAAISRPASSGSSVSA